MTWAEKIGIGEMGLMPEQFWSLLVREFRLKHAAFMRQEDRIHSWVIEHALLTGHIKPEKQTQVERTKNQLRRYPIKAWLR